MTDIEQMFYQLYVRSKDRDALRFLWRDNLFLPICNSEILMNVHLLGKMDSPCCANWTLKRTALDRVNYYRKKVTEAPLTRFYMDAYLDLFSNKEAAINVSTKVKQLLSNGGLNLTNFSSNNQDILKSLPTTNTVKSTDINLDLDEIPIERVVKVLWQPEKDTLKIKSVEKKLPATEREILSFISTIFDPIGFVTPAVLEQKLIMQEL